MIHSRPDADWHLEALHKRSTHHREAILASEWCSCFYCLSQFQPSRIERWLAGEGTALCPECGIDAVLPDSPDRQTLQNMHLYWFGAGA